ncbi:cyclic nucleotide-binding domain-containing protein [Luteolibacter marinus]|uniref:cyclic nucleotide-binding domain-containing protein n=1 Tax=Luteolibacter marinus TaxID=2776705 RepID=UPI0018664438
MKAGGSIQRTALAASLSQAPVFAGLPEAELVRIASYSSIVPLARNEILFREGDPVTGFFVLRRGLIKAFRTIDGSREQLIHLVHPGQSFAEPAIAGLPGYPAHTRAMEASEVILIPRRPFLDHLKQRPELSLRMLSSLSRHLHDLVGTIENYQLRDAGSRFVHWLRSRCSGGHGPAEIRMNTTKALLAEELGTRPETLSRILARLQAEERVIVKGRRIVIPDPRRLDDIQFSIP